LSRILEVWIKIPPPIILGAKTYDSLVTWQMIRLGHQMGEMISAATTVRHDVIVAVRRRGIHAAATAVVG